jgi:hypothetical protein
MDQTALRAAAGLDYENPSDCLVRLRSLEIEVALSDLPYKVKSLRINSLKEARELRSAALFCYGLGQRLGHTVFFARGESQDYDFIASWVIGTKQHILPVQLKELVPHELNSDSNLPTLIQSLKKYTDSTDLTVVIHLNRQTRFESADIQCTSLNIGGLWVFGAATLDQSEWNLWGNFIEEPFVSRFSYPKY